MTVSHPFMASTRRVLFVGLCLLGLVMIQNLLLSHEAANAKSYLRISNHSLFSDHHSPDSFHRYQHHNFRSVNITKAVGELESDLCRPEDRDNGKVVLAKLRKTGGSTLAVILARYGYERNLSFALPKEHNNRFGYKHFEPNMLLSEPDGEGFDILFNHVPFNKSNMKQVMNRKAKYITIVRDTVSRFYSAVNYYGVLALVGMKGDLYSPTFPLRELLYRIEHCNATQCQATYNGQMFDLGRFDNGSRTTLPQLQDKIKRIDDDFDLVLVQSYFDESLILLKKMMCWKYEDIVYIPQKVHFKGRYSPAPKHEAIIKEWNYEDDKLFKYFNKSLWRRIEQYGPSFYDDLMEFKETNRVVQKRCHSPRSSVRLCKNLYRGPTLYVKLLRALIDKTNKQTRK